MSSRIIVIQPECRTRAGHPYAAIKSLEHAIAPAKLLFCIHRRASPSLDLASENTVRHFNGRIAVREENEHSIGEARGTREFKGALDRMAVTPDDHLVFPSADAETVLAVLHALRQRETASWPHCHFRFIGDEHRRDLESSAHKLLSKYCGSASRVHFYAEFEANVRHVLKYYEQNPFKLTRLPTLWPNQIETSANPREDRWFTIGVFGPPRRDKGKHRLGRIFGKLAAELGRSHPRRPLRILIQNDHRLDRALSLYASLVAGLRTNARAVRILPARMSSEAFIAHMLNCDVVVLPYIPDTYVIRGSGIAIDAAIHGIPIVCTRGTAMCELVESGNGLTASTDQEFAQCLATVAQNAAQFSEAARQVANRTDDWWSGAMLDALRRLPT